MMSLYSDRLKSKQTASNLGLITSLIIGGVVALIIGLVWISKPFDAKARLADLNAQAKQIEAIADRKGDLKKFPAGTVCSQGMTDQDRLALTNLISNSSIKIILFDLNEAGQVGDRVEFTTYHFTLKGRGSYEQALSTVDALNHYQPKLFLSSLALRNHIDEVELEIEGDFYCR